MLIDKKILYNNIKSLCDKNGLTMYQLEQKAGLSRHTISKCDVVSISWERVAVIANYFNVSMDFLIGNTCNPHSHIESLKPASVIVIEAAEKLNLSESNAEKFVKIMEVLCEDT